MEQIQALRFDVQQVGKHVKGSKKRYCWEIALRDKAHSILLDFSFLSGKIKITVDRKILLENELPADVAFQYPFNLDGFALNLIQQGESFQLRINNKVFSHLYTQQKTNTEFKKYEDQVKDIKVDLAHLNPQGKKISLNIGAFGGQGMKKKKEVGGEQSWNAFAGGSFPSYFGETQPEKPKASPPQKSNLLDDEQQNAVAERTANEFNLLQAEKVESKTNNNFFQLISNDPPTDNTSNSSASNTSQEFNTMQQMFKTLSVSNTKANQLDFFADQSKQTVVKEQVKAATKAPVFDFSQQSSGITGFGTGFGLQGMGQLNSKTFATSAGAGSKGFDLNSLDFSMPAKQEPVNAFSKKSPQESPYSPMDQVFATQSQTQAQTQPTNSPVFTGSSNINDFNTMQLMLQTNSNFGNPAEFNFGQTQPQTQTQTQHSVQNQLPPQFGTNQQFQGNAEDFGTSMLRMFQTNTPTQSPPLSQMSLNINPPEPVVQKPAQPNPLDLFSNSKPTSFATVSGGNFPPAFDMASFGTMQANTKGADLDFFNAKPTKPANNSSAGDLI